LRLIAVWVGVLFPVFVGLLLLFLLADMVWVSIAFTLLSLLLLLGLVVIVPFFLLCPKHIATTTTTTTEDTTTPEPQAPES
jgi:hypothetical protein